MINYLTNKLLTVVEEKLSKEEVVELLAERMAQNTKVVKDKGAFLEKVFQREEVGTTGIGMGVVVPHARSESVEDIIVSIALLKHPIEFNTPDGEDAQLVILVGAPKTKNKEYLNLLARIARIFRNKDYRKSVFEATSEEELIEAMSEL